MPRAQAVAQFAVAEGDMHADAEFIFDPDSVWGAGTGPRDETADAQFQVEAALAEMWNPESTAITGMQALIYGFEVWAGGVLVSLDDLVGPIRVSHDISRHIQTAQFTVRGLTLGNAVSFGTQPLCADDIDIYGVFQGSTGTVLKFPLILGGIVDNMQPILGPLGEHTETFNIAGPGARYVDKLINVILPAGHKLYRHKVVRRLLEDAGVTSFNLHASDRQMLKEVQAVDARPVDVAQEIQDPEMRRLLWHQDGDFGNPALRAPSYFASKLTINANTFVRGRLRMSIPGSVITEAILTGTKQLLNNEDEEPCADESRTLVVEVTEAYSPATMTQVQAANCTLSASAGVEDDAVDRVVSRVTNTATTRCRTLVFEKATTELWHNPVVPRFEWDGLGTTLDCRAGVLLPTNAAAGTDDTVEGGKWLREKFGVVFEEEIAHYYDADGYYGYEWLDYTRPWRFHYVDSFPLTSQAKTAVAGSKLGTVRRLWGWYNPRVALKTRAAASDPWTNEDHIAATKTLADGSGVAYDVTNASEVWLELERDFELLYPRDDGLLERREVYEHRYRVEPGNLYLYNSGEEGGSAIETFGLARRIVETYLQVSPDTYKVITTETDYRTGKTRTTSETRTGGIPPIDRLPGYENDELEDLTAEEQELFSGDVDPTNVQPISYTAQSTLAVEDGGCHLARTIKTALAYAEDQTELRFVGEQLIDESVAWHATVTCLPLWPIRIGDKVTINLPEYGLTTAATVHAFDHAWDGRLSSPILTDLQLRLHYPVAA
jgi:hypothetical protein